MENIVIHIYAGNFLVSSFHESDKTRALFSDRILARGIGFLPPGSDLSARASVLATERDLIGFWQERSDTSTIVSVFYFWNWSHEFLTRVIGRID